MEVEVRGAAGAGAGAGAGAAQRTLQTGKHLSSQWLLEVETIFRTLQGMSQAAVVVDPGTLAAFAFSYFPLLQRNGNFKNVHFWFSEVESWWRAVQSPPS